MQEINELIKKSAKGKRVVDTFIGLFSRETWPESVERKIQEILDGIPRRLDTSLKNLVDKRAELEEAGLELEEVLKQQAEALAPIESGIAELEREVDELEEIERNSVERLTERKNNFESAKALILQNRQTKEQENKKLKEEIDKVAQELFEGNVLQQKLNQIRVFLNSEENIEPNLHDIEASISQVAGTLRFNQEQKEKFEQAVEDKSLAIDLLQASKMKKVEERGEFLKDHPWVAAILIFLSIMSEDPAKKENIEIELTNEEIKRHQQEITALEETLAKDDKKKISLDKQKQYLSNLHSTSLDEEDLKRLSEEYTQIEKAHKVQIKNNVAEKKSKSVEIKNLQKQRESALKPAETAKAIIMNLSREAQEIQAQIEDLRQGLDFGQSLQTAANDEQAPAEIAENQPITTDGKPSANDDNLSVIDGLTDIESLSLEDDSSKSENQSLSDDGLSEVTSGTLDTERELDSQPTTPRSSQSSAEISRGLSNASSSQSLPKVSSSSIFSSSDVINKSYNVRNVREYQADLAEKYKNYLLRAAGFAGVITGHRIEQHFYEDMSTKFYLLLNGADLNIRRLFTKERYKNVNKEKLITLQRIIQRIGIYRESGETLTEALLVSLHEARQLIDEILDDADKDQNFNLAISSMGINFDELKDYLNLTVKTSFILQNSATAKLQQQYARFELMSNPGVLQLLLDQRLDIGMMSYSFQKLKHTLDEISKSDPNSSIGSYAAELVAEFSGRNDEIVQTKTNQAVAVLNDIYKMSFRSLRKNLPSYYSALNASAVIEPEVAKTNCIALLDVVLELRNSLEGKDKLDSNLELVEELISVASKNLSIYLHAQTTDLSKSVRKEINKLEHNLLEFHFNCGEAMHIVEGQPPLTRTKNKDEIHELQSKIENSLQTLSDALPEQASLFDKVISSITLSANLVAQSDSLLHTDDDSPDITRRL